jgi:acetyl esterase
VPLDPRVARIVAIANRVQPSSEGATMAQRRAASAATSKRGRAVVMASGPAAASERDVLIPVAGGQIVVRIYAPHTAGPTPLHVFLHGGGWCVGTLDERDPRCREIVAGANCTVASVDYRMAPENAYPTPPEDCYAALCWLVDHAEELGIDPDRVSIGGESAGANLAAVVCLMARDRSGPALRYQWLDVPATDLTLSQPSVHEVPDGHLLDLDVIHEYREAYLGDVERCREPYASPLLADDLSGLPPAWIMSAEFDKLRDDGVAYAAALKAAGVEVELQILPGQVHPTFAFTRLIPASKAYERQAIAALARALHA